MMKFIIEIPFVYVNVIHTWNDMAVFQKMAPSILSMNVGNILSHKDLIQFEILIYLYYKVSGNFTAASLKS